MIQTLKYKMEYGDDIWISASNICANVGRRYTRMLRSWRAGHRLLDFLAHIVNRKAFVRRLQICDSSELAEAVVGRKIFEQARWRQTFEFLSRMKFLFAESSHSALIILDMTSVTIRGKNLVDDYVIREISQTGLNLVGFNYPWALRLLSEFCDVQDSKSFFSLHNIALFNYHATLSWEYDSSIHAQNLFNE